MFHWNLNFVILLMANSLNLDSAYYNFTNFLMIAHIIKIQISKFVNIQFCEFDQSEPGC